MFRKIIDKTKNDCTPFDLVVDAVIVGQLADLLIFVVRENHTDRRKLPELEHIYHSNKPKNMRIVLNGSRSEAPSKKYNAYYNKKNITMLPKSSAYNTLSGNSGYLTENTNYIQFKRYEPNA